MRTAVALRSDWGNRLSNLRRGLEAIVTEDLPLLVRSDVLEIPPGKTDGDRCLCTCALFDFSGDPRVLPAVLARSARRVEGGSTSEPPPHRVLSWDLLFVEDLQIDEPPDCILPHPFIAQRGDLLVPLAQIAPDWVHPSLAASLRDLVDGFPREKFVRIVRFQP
jgi:7,8-dihydro-6-hydroxymethylpterin-pyrophosphokinase